MPAGDGVVEMCFVDFAASALLQAVEQYVHRRAPVALALSAVVAVRLVPIGRRGRRVQRRRLGRDVDPEVAPFAGYERGHSAP
jgi:hypothetical protein